VNRAVLPWLGGAVLAGSAAFVPGDLNGPLLLLIMLAWPLFDHATAFPVLQRHRRQWVPVAVLLCVAAAILVYLPTLVWPAITTLLFAALPEEWFFRMYMQTRFGHGPVAIIASSLVFSIVHGLTQDWMMALWVFPPSLCFGWIYHATRNFPLVVLTHGAANLAYFAGIKDCLVRSGLI
jgi:membrane protease YdiL (CAAX protease family)